MTEKTDVLNPNWWADFVIGLLDKGEWKILLATLALTFTFTYILKLVYFANLKASAYSAYHIRGIAFASGLAAGFMKWKGTDSISLTWYEAGLLVGFLSIGVHHLIEEVSKRPPVNKVFPWLYPLIKGQAEKRKSIRKKKS